ncbi:MAG TPA: hypothetical protein VGD37_36555, partial [Kofleriaceae bacterium]
MRAVVSWLVTGLACVVAWSITLAAAAPRPKPPRPTAGKAARPAPGKATPAHDAELAELAELDKQFTQLTIKQASFAAAKVARKALALQIKATGPDSIEAQRRKQTLAGLLGGIGDYRGQMTLDQELLATAERLHGAESRETLT